MNSPQKYIIQDIRDFVPVWLRPWILIAFLLVFQVSGGVYLASANEMSSGLALLNEDIMMAGYASLIGMLLVFVIMLRLKFRFSIKTSIFNIFRTTDNRQQTTVFVHSQSQLLIISMN